MSMSEQAPERDTPGEPEAGSAQGEAADPEAAAEPAGEESLEAAVERHRAEANEQREQALRLAAELDNVRKRSQREIENARKYGVERFAGETLTVRDTLEAALNTEGADVETVLEGTRATLRLLDDALTNAGISEVDPLGEPFDPTLHEAMAMRPSDRAEPGSVVEVVQKGYQIHERLLRPARVIVAQEPPEAEGSSGPAE